MESHERQRRSASLVGRRLPILPNRPALTTHDIMAIGDGNISSFEAATEVERLWHHWAWQAEVTLLQIIDQLETITQPESDLAELTSRIARFEGRPGLPTLPNEVEVDAREFPKTWMLRKLTDMVYRRIHVEWRIWADQVDGVRALLVEKIQWEKEDQAEDEVSSEVFDDMMSSLSVSLSTPPPGSVEYSNVEAEVPRIDLRALIVAMLAQKEDESTEAWDAACLGRRLGSVDELNEELSKMIIHGGDGREDGETFRADHEDGGGSGELTGGNIEMELE